ncbi:hypothetical protein BSAF29S_02149 [Bacillus safensis subsp. safensis]
MAEISGFDIHDDDVREEVLNTLKTNKHLEITNSSPTNIEVNAAGINKAAALAKVAERIGCTMDNVMSLGDSLNGDGHDSRSRIRHCDGKCPGSGERGG